MSLDVYTAATPNGWKITVMIEELVEAGVELPEVNLHTVSLGGEQFLPEFVAICPNQKIPAIVHDGPGDHGKLRHSPVSRRDVPVAAAAARRTALGRHPVALLAGSQHRPNLRQQAELYPLHQRRHRGPEGASTHALRQGVAAAPGAYWTGNSRNMPTSAATSSRSRTSRPGAGSDHGNGPRSISRASRE